MKFLNKVFNILSNYKLLLITLIPILLYSLLMADKTMPFAEGWYTYYAQCINNGQIVYKDFDYLFTPFYIYFITFFTRIFGYKIIVLRYLGVLFFSIIAVLVFFTIKEIFNKRIACITTIVSVFYLQTEIVQVFYDYIRFMDIFSIMTVLFLIKATKNISDSNKKDNYYRIFIVLAGLSNSLFFLIKQNMGGAFFVFSLIFLTCVHLVLRKPKKETIINITSFCIGFLIPIFITLLFLIYNNNLDAFVTQIFTNAVSAKGGLNTIMFGWLINQKGNLRHGFRFSREIFLILLILYFLKNKFIASITNKGKYIEKICCYCFCIFISLFLFLLNYSKDFSNIFFKISLNPYRVFMFVAPLFWFYVFHTIYLYLRKKPINNRELLFIALTGAYFTIAWGCGMSGGLAEGQSTLGIAVLFAIFLEVLQFKYSWILKGIIVVIAFIFTLQSASAKMINSYNWWGMTEAEYWENKYESKKIDLLKGIKLSKETLNVYETIYDVIANNTNSKDFIYCFPQIPIFYSICNRKDPGVRAKVQWFDVVSNTSIKNDIKVLENNPPKVILIYDSSDVAYEGHERAFGRGQKSSTRIMKEFLLDFVKKNNYILKKVTSNKDNNIFIYYKENIN